MTRRLIFVFLATILSLVLSGCGGGGDGSTTPTPGGGKLTITPVTGTVILPQGRTRAITDYTVVTSVGEAKPNAQGNFTVPVVNGGPQLAFLVDDQDETVMMAMVGEKGAEISADTTAKTLLFMSLGGHYFGGEQSIVFWDEISALKNDMGLADAVAAEISAAKNMGGVHTAVENKLADLRTSLGASGGKGIVVNPSNAQSGVIVENFSFNQIKLVNHFRRRCLVYVDQIAYAQGTGESQQWTFLDEPLPTTNFRLKPTKGYESVGASIALAYQGGSFFVPEASNPVTLNYAPTTADRVRYRVLVLGFGNVIGEAYNELTEERKDALAKIQWEHFFLEVCVPIFSNVILGAREGDVDVSQFSSQDRLLALAGLTLSASPKAFTAAKEGNYRLAILEVNNTLADNDLFRRQFLGDFVDILRDEFGSEVGSERFRNVASKLMNAFRIVDILGTMFDTHAQLQDYVQSKQVERFEVDLTKGNVTLTPERSSMTPSDTLELTANALNVELDGGALVYEWSHDGEGNLADNVHFGNDFESSQNRVRYFAGTGERNTVTVKVKVSLRRAGQTEEVGESSAVIEVQPSTPILAPDVTSLGRGETQTFDVAMSPPWDGPQLFYRFELEEGLGGLTNYGTWSQSPAVEFEAGQEYGTETLRVEVGYREDGIFKTVGTATAEIRIEERRSIIFGTYVTMQRIGEDNRHATLATVVIPKVEGATRYSLRAVGGFDPHYYGDGPIRYSSPFKHDWQAEVPEGEMWQGISGAWGPASGAGQAFSYMESRFASGWKWIVEVTY